MNKKLLVSVLLLSAMTLMCQAQVWLGGSMSIHTNSTTLDNYNMDNRLVFNISPEVGYVINSHWAVAMKVGYAYLKHANITVMNQTLPGSGNEFSIKPFARYIFKPLGRFRFYADAGPSYALLQRHSDSNLHTIGIRANLGVMFDINSRWSLTGYLGDIGYDHSWVKVNRVTVRDNAFRFDVINNFGLGVIVNLGKK